MRHWNFFSVTFPEAIQEVISLYKILEKTMVIFGKLGRSRSLGVGVGGEEQSYGVDMAV